MCLVIEDATALRSSAVAGPAPAVEAGTRIYAIGDVHGHLDLLTRLMDLIVADARQAPAGTRPRIVMLGDYVDRGPASRGVLDLLSGPPPSGFERICLKGNHESMMEIFMEDPRMAGGWLPNGGAEAVNSYGLSVDSSEPVALERLSMALRRAVPATHHRFLAELDLMHVCGDYFFAHAGVDPTRPLDQQRGEALMWIRGPFLNSGVDFGKIVVHGHTITARPEVRSNRIGIDTGAYASGRLTCLVLDGTSRRFITACGDTNKEKC